MLAIDRGIARVLLPTLFIRSSHAGAHGSGAGCEQTDPSDARTP